MVLFEMVGFVLLALFVASAMSGPMGAEGRR